MIKKVRQEDGGTVVEMSGRFDAPVAPEVKSQLHERIAEGDINLVINLSEVDFIDSSGLGVFVSCLRRVASRGGDLRLAEVREELRSTFELTRLTRVFNIEESEEEALEALKQPEEE